MQFPLATQNACQLDSRPSFLQRENQELQARLASSAAKRPVTPPTDLLAQIKLLEDARETLTGQLADQAQEARSARLELETRLEKAELERTEAEEKLKSVQAEMQLLEGSGSADKVRLRIS